MKIAFTAKVTKEAFVALSVARKSVQAEMEHLIIDYKIIDYKDRLPDLELIFCPLVFPKLELQNWPDKIRRSKVKGWISIEKSIAFEPFIEDTGVKGASFARSTFSRWIKVTMRDAERQFPELTSARLLFDGLAD